MDQAADTDIGDDLDIPVPMVQKAHLRAGVLFIEALERMEAALHRIEVALLVKRQPRILMRALDVAPLFGLPEDDHVRWFAYMGANGRP